MCGGTCLYNRHCGMRCATPTLQGFAVWYEHYCRVVWILRCCNQVLDVVEAPCDATAAVHTHAIAEQQVSALLQRYQEDHI